MVQAFCSAGHTREASLPVFKRDSLLRLWVILFDNSAAIIVGKIICRHLGTSSSNMVGPGRCVIDCKVRYSSLLMFNLGGAVDLSLKQVVERTFRSVFVFRPLFGSTVLNSRRRYRLVWEVVVTQKPSRNLHLWRYGYFWEIVKR